MSADGKNFVFLRTRPELVIEGTGGGSLGNCYSANGWRVTSVHRLTAETLRGLNALGLLGIGQEFYVNSQADGKEEPAGVDTVPCVVVDKRTGKRLDEPAINPYSGEPYGSHDYPYFVYDCESRCDSGD